MTIRKSDYKTVAFNLLHLPNNCSDTGFRKCVYNEALSVVQRCLQKEMKNPHKLRIMKLRLSVDFVLGPFATLV